MEIIAFQGVPGAYSSLACHQLFPLCQTYPCLTFEEAMQAVEKGHAHAAVIPIENSTAGRVEEIYRLIPKLSLFITQEFFLPINHCLLARHDQSKADITEVYSHPQALAQCKHAIERCKIMPKAYFDTAGAAKWVSEQKTNHQAAIASTEAAQLYNLCIIEEHFEDNHTNQTRFIVLEKTLKTPLYTEHAFYISSLVFSVQNEPAALYHALGCFLTPQLNLLKIESYMHDKTDPISKFHIDIDTHIDSPDMKICFKALKKISLDIKILGCYVNSTKH